MEFENKVISKEINTLLYEKGKTLGTAESCTGGHIAEAIVASPGSSNYFKGSIVSYVDEKTAVCEEVAIAMVKGACKVLATDYAISATGYAGPGGGTKEIPVGTIWLACGTADDVVTLQLTEDDGRDKNISKAATQALQLFLNYLKEHPIWNKYQLRTQKK